MKICGLLFEDEKSQQQISLQKIVCEFHIQECDMALHQIYVN